MNAIYVDDALSEGIEVREVVDPETRRKATAAVARAFEGAQGVRSVGRGIPESMINDLARWPR